MLTWNATERMCKIDFSMTGISHNTMSVQLPTSCERIVLSFLPIRILYNINTECRTIAIDRSARVITRLIRELIFRRSDVFHNEEITLASRMLYCVEDHKANLITLRNHLYQQCRVRVMSAVMSPFCDRFVTPNMMLDDIADTMSSSDNLKDLHRCLIEVLCGDSNLFDLRIQVKRVIGTHVERYGNLDGLDVICAYHLLDTMCGIIHKWVHRASISLLLSMYATP